MQYFAAKAITLSGMALVACTILLIVMRDAENPALLLVTVALTSLTYVGIGVPIALRFRTVNGYLIGSSGFLIADDRARHRSRCSIRCRIWLLLIPSAAQFRLILIATGAGQASAGEIAFMLAVCALGCGRRRLAWRLASLRKELGK